MRKGEFSSYLSLPQSFAVMLDIAQPFWSSEEQIKAASWQSTLQILWDIDFAFSCGWRPSQSGPVLAGKCSHPGNTEIIRKALINCLEKNQDSDEILLVLRITTYS